MRTIVSLVWAILLVTTGCAGQSSRPLQIQIDSLRLKHISREEITAEVLLTVTAPKGLHLQRLALKNIHANGIPVFADPLEDGFTTTGGPVALPPVQLHLFPVDIDGAAGLEQALRENTISLTAEAVLDVQANLLQRLLLGESHPVAVWAVKREVPFHTPEGLAGAGLGVLLMTMRAARQVSGMAFADSETDGVSGTARVRTCWTPADVTRRCTEHLAFAAGARYLTAAQATEPWRYDPLLSQQPPAVGSSVETVLLAGGTETPVTATVLQQPEVRRVLLLPVRKWVSYVEAGSSMLYAELHPKALALQPPPLTPLPVAPRAVCSWQAAHVYRLSPQGHGLETITLRVQWGDERIHFSRPLDEGAAGSPIVTADGVIGVVQSENAGTAIEPLRGCSSL